MSPPPRGLPFNNDVQDCDDEAEEGSFLAAVVPNAMTKDSEDGDRRPSSNTSLRSIGSSRSLAANDSSGNLRDLYHGAVRLVQGTGDHDGFVNGHFGSGKIRDLIVVNNTHHVILGNLLIVAVPDGLDIYETNSYNLAHRYPIRNSVVSVLKGQSAQFSSLIRLTTSVLAVGTCNGQCMLFYVDEETVEPSGLSLLHEFTIPGEITALDLAYLPDGGGDISNGLLVLVAGDVNGNVHIASYRNLGCLGVTMSAMQFSTCVLALAIGVSQSCLAVGTQGGEVAIHSLKRPCTRHKKKAGDDELYELLDRQWYTERSGAVRSMTWAGIDEQFLAVGGYDKRVAIFDTKLWIASRELPLQGTVSNWPSAVTIFSYDDLNHLFCLPIQVSVIAFDPKYHYMAVGCRDKTLTLFDTSTYVPVKVFHTEGWVTCVSWMSPCRSGNELLIVRASATCLSVLDLSPIHMTSIHLSSSTGDDSSLSWSANGRFLARSVGANLAIVDSGDHFVDVASYTISSAITNLAFGRTREAEDRIALIDILGTLSVFRLVKYRTEHRIEKQKTVFVEPSLRALCWSPDGTSLAVGGKGKKLYLYSSDMLALKFKPVQLDARVWQITFCPERTLSDDNYLTLALGDYSCVVLNKALVPTLRIVRSRTVRCVQYHPRLPLLVMGDGAGSVAVVDVAAEETLFDLDGEARVNVVEFSPVGDYLVVGTDDGRFAIYETSQYSCVQQVDGNGFALTAAFSPVGRYLALGSSTDAYAIIQLGPFLGIELTPLSLENGITASLPQWALNEVLFRSGNGPSLIQRHMIHGGADNLRRVATILKDYPGAMFAFDREKNETCYDTAVLLRKPNLLKLAVTTLVDGTLDAYNVGNQSILTTEIPMRARSTLQEIVDKFAPETVVDIFDSMVFQKVPFTFARTVRSTKQLYRGSSNYTDPWRGPKRVVGSNRKGSVTLPSGEYGRGDLSRTPAVLPLPGLGEMDFLSSLLATGSPDVFDNQAMALVLKVLWSDHIWKYFIFDTTLYVIFCAFWIWLVEETVALTGPISFRGDSLESIVVLGTMVLNTVFAMKEFAQSRYGRRTSYFKSPWNVTDMMSIIGVYVYCIEAFTHKTGGEILVPWSVVTSLLLTIKMLSYLRGFSDTGWLISVLSANFRDVRGFLIILFAILVGFSLSFRALLGGTGEESFGSIRRSLLSTFELSIVGTYDPIILHETEHPVVSALTFVLAVTCVLVIALNALISVLADSYARVQAKATANRRKERAELIVEYMSLLPPWRRRRIERNTKWFHILLEVDSTGDLLVQSDDWEGGLNALRHDIERMDKDNRDYQEKTLQNLKSDLDSELNNVRKEIAALLGDLSDEVKQLKKVQGGVMFSGKTVARAVKAVKSIGGTARKKTLPNDG